MAAGAGFYDANGVWQYGETDAIALFSDTLNKGMDSVSDAIGADRTRLTTAENDITQIDSQIADIFAQISDTGWATVTFTGWTVASAVQFRRIGRVVYVRGEIFGGTPGGTVIATLSTGLRPPVRSAFPLLDLGSGTADGRLNIETTGAVTIYGGNGGASSPGLSLAGVSYCLA
jgi:hypothetical protein